MKVAAPPGLAGGVVKPSAGGPEVVGTKRSWITCDICVTHLDACQKFWYVSHMSIYVTHAVHVLVYCHHTCGLLSHFVVPHMHDSAHIVATCTALSSQHGAHNPCTKQAHMGSRYAAMLVKVTRMGEAKQGTGWSPYLCNVTDAWYGATSNWGSPLQLVPRPCLVP